MMEPNEPEGEHEHALISRYIVTDRNGRGPDEASLARYGVSVWALVAYLTANKLDPAQVAADYDLPEDAVEAALAYYRCHKEIIDARILLNQIAFT